MSNQLFLINKKPLIIKVTTSKNKKKMLIYINSIILNFFILNFIKSDIFMSKRSFTYIASVLPFLDSQGILDY